MKLLLTSAGITNTSIRDVLVDLLGKPIEDSKALCIPTAIYAFPGGAISAWKLITGRAASPLCELGWRSLGVLELTALPSIDGAHWRTVVKETDALLGEVAIRCTCATGSSSRDWPTSCRRCAGRSGWA